MMPLLCRLVQAEHFELVARYGLAIGVNLDHLKNAVKKAQLLTRDALGSAASTPSREPAALPSIALRLKRVVFRFEHDPFEIRLARTLTILREEAEQQVWALAVSRVGLYVFYKLSRVAAYTLHLDSRALGRAEGIQSC